MRMRPRLGTLARPARRLTRPMPACAQVVSKGNDDGKVSAASALANLIANSDANKKRIIAMPDVLPRPDSLLFVATNVPAGTRRLQLNVCAHARVHAACIPRSWVLHARAR